MGRVEFSGCSTSLGLVLNSKIILLASRRSQSLFKRRERERREIYKEEMRRIKEIKRENGKVFNGTRLWIIFIRLRWMSWAKTLTQLNRNPNWERGWRELCYERSTLENERRELGYERTNSNNEYWKASDASLATNVRTLSNVSLVRPNDNWFEQPRKYVGKHKQMIIRLIRAGPIDNWLSSIGANIWIRVGDPRVLGSVRVSEDHGSGTLGF